MKPKDMEYIHFKILDEGLDYCLRYYSDFDDIEDEEFHRLRLAYISIAEAIEDYVCPDNLEEE